MRDGDSSLSKAGSAAACSNGRTNAARLVVGWQRRTAEMDGRSLRTRARAGSDADAVRAATDGARVRRPDGRRPHTFVRDARARGRSCRPEEKAAALRATARNGNERTAHGTKNRSDVTAVSADRREISAHREEKSADLRLYGSTGREPSLQSARRAVTARRLPVTRLKNRVTGRRSPVTRQLFARLGRNRSVTGQQRRGSIDEG